MWWEVTDDTGRYGDIALTSIPLKGSMMSQCVFFQNLVSNTYRTTIDRRTQECFNEFRSDTNAFQQKILEYIQNT